MVQFQLVNYSKWIELDVLEGYYEYSISTKGRKFLGWLNDKQLLWKVCAARRSLVCLNDRATASSKASSSQSAIWCFLFQFPVSCFFPYDHTTVAYVFFFVFPSLLSLHLSFLQYVV